MWNWKKTVYASTPYNDIFLHCDDFHWMCAVVVVPCFICSFGFFMKKKIFLVELNSASCILYYLIPRQKREYLWCDYLSWCVFYGILRAVYKIFSDYTFYRRHIPNRNFMSNKEGERFDGPPLKMLSYLRKSNQEIADIKW